MSIQRNLVLAIGLTAFLAGSAMAQQEIYKWRDKSGAMHYSSTPPKSGKFERRVVANGVAATATAPAPTVAAQGTAAAGEHPSCATARSNLKALNDTSRPVMMDKDGDGKPDAALDAAQRAQEVGKTNDFMKQNNCKTG